VEEKALATKKANNTKSTSRNKTGGASRAKANNSSASKAKQNQKNKSSAQVKEHYVPTEKDIKLKNEIKLLIALVVTLLLLLSNFGFLSPVGDYLSYFMFGLFGFIAYIFPLVMFFGVAFLISNINNKRGIKKFIAGCALYILVSATIQLVFMEYDNTLSAFDYYKICGKGKVGGGLIGALIEKSLHSLFGMLGTYIILALLIIITVVILTEKSFISGVKKGSSAVYETAKEDAVRIKKTAKSIANERAYQKKEKRVDNRVHGVNIATVGNGNATEDEDIHEIGQEIMSKLSSDDMEVYNGHVELEEGFDYNEMPNKENSSDNYNVTNNSNVESGNVVNNNSLSSNSLNSNSYKEDTSEEYDGYDNEDGLYVPKEQIHVSNEAKQVMNRKAFSVGNVNVTGSVASSAVNATGSVTGSVARDGSANGAANISANKPNSTPAPTRKKAYTLPSTALLNKGNGTTKPVDNAKLRMVANKLQEILHTFGINATVVDFCRGPSVTRYEIQPETGTRINKITSLADDIKLNMAATDISIEPVPGKSTIGIEVPNEGRDTVLIRELIESKELRANSSKIAFAAGKDIAGNVVVADIGKMPHMLVAGTTGSGKSVFTNSIIMSILFRAKPEEVRLIIVDPKVVEFGVYNGIPHLLQPVVTDPKMAANTLKWAVAEMSERYKKFADFNVRDLKGYNEKIESAGKELGLTKLPQIVIVIDELADLMMVAAKDVEESICRLAQLARAAGIHLIIATQRPSVDVVTGLIKANIPSRCALMVSSGTDSRTIIDSNGAEKLLGNGDMLFYPSGYVKPVRLQGAFVSDQEVQRVVDFWKAQADGNTYDESIASYVKTPEASSQEGDRDDYFFEAAKLVIQKEKASASMLQRYLNIGFNRASKIIDQLYDAGVIGDEEGTKPRKVIMTMEQLENLT
jgi:S-DNA-T family DNA segregation ATPase FtsK/SpoIIIE